MRGAGGVISREGSSGFGGERADARDRRSCKLDGTPKKLDALFSNSFHGKPLVGRKHLVVDLDWICACRILVFRLIIEIHFLDLLWLGAGLAKACI